MIFELTIWRAKSGLRITSDARTVAGLVGNIVNGLFPVRSGKIQLLSNSVITNRSGLAIFVRYNREFVNN